MKIMVEIKQGDGVFRDDVILPAKYQNDMIGAAQYIKDCGGIITDEEFFPVHLIKRVYAVDDNV